MENGKYYKESYSTQSKIGQNALIQSNNSEQAMIIMGDTIEDMDTEIEHKDNKIEISEKKIEIPDSKVIEERNRLEFNETGSKRKGDRTMDIINFSLKCQEYIKKKQ